MWRAFSRERERETDEGEGVSAGCVDLDTRFDLQGDTLVVLKGEGH